MKKRAISRDFSHSTSLSTAVEDGSMVLGSENVEARGAAISRFAPASTTVENVGSGRSSILARSLGLGTLSEAKTT